MSDLPTDKPQEQENIIKESNLNQMDGNSFVGNAELLRPSGSGATQINLRSPFRNSLNLFPLHTTSLADASQKNSHEKEESNLVSNPTTPNLDPVKKSCGPQNNGAARLFPFATCPSKCENCPFLQEINNGNLIL